MKVSILVRMPADMKEPRPDIAALWTLADMIGTGIETLPKDYGHWKATVDEDSGIIELVTHCRGPS